MKKAILTLTLLTLSAIGWAQSINQLTKLTMVSLTNYFYENRPNFSCTLDDGTNLYFYIDEYEWYEGLVEHNVILRAITTTAKQLTLPSEYNFEGELIYPKQISIEPQFYNSKDAYELNALTFPTQLEELVIPDKTDIVTSLPFENLQSVTLPSSLKYIDATALSMAKESLKDIYCEALTPPMTKGEAISDYVDDPTLHVPAAGLDAYNADDNWKLAHTQSIDYPLDKVEVWQGEFKANTSQGMEDVTLLMPMTTYLTNDYYILTKNESNKNSTPRWGQLTVDDKDGEVHFVGIEIQANPSPFPADSKIYLPSFIANTSASVDIAKVKFNFNRRFGYNPHPYYISLPFDAVFGDMQKKESVEMAWYGFDGARRATNGSGSAWRRLSPDSIMHANQGYCMLSFHDYSKNPFNGNTVNIKETEVELTAIANQNLNKIVSYDDMLVPLKKHPSFVAFRQNWNFTGNPYPSYYDISYMDLTTPITVVNTDYYLKNYDNLITIYKTVSPLDDHYILSPFEAFFIQCPEEVEGIKYSRDGRQHTPFVREESAKRQVRRKTEAEIGSTRLLYDFQLANSDFYDQTRLVVNEDADMEYELTRDAAKMLPDANVVPQVWIEDAGTEMAIDERPLGNGIFELGACFPCDGKYTLTLKSTVGDYDVAIYDNQTQAYASLSDQPYTFDAIEGISTSRLTIILTPHSSTSIDEKSFHTEHALQEVYDLQGRRINNGDIKTKGIYIKGNRKYIVK